MSGAGNKTKNGGRNDDGDKAFEVGDTVWVQTGWQGREEVGTIVDGGCEYTVHKGHEEEGEDDDEVGVRQDGWLVKLQISNYRSVFAPQALRRFDSGGQNKRRKSAATEIRDESSAARVASASTSASASRRAAVTPSPCSSVVEASDERQSHQEGDTMEKGAPSKTAAAAKARAKISRKRKPTKDAPETSPKRPQKKPNNADGPQSDDGEDTGPVVSDPPLEAETPTKKRQEQKSDSSDDLPLSTLKKPRKKAASLAPAPNDDSDKEDEPLSTLKKKARTANKQKVEKKPEESDQEDDALPESDDDDGTKPIYYVEYASTGRARCRRCEGVISKGDLRVSHVPLFRGKPGFTVYRHLACAAFDDVVRNKTHVGGWRRLKKSDQDILEKRIQESFVERQEEQEALEPDELVQVTFQGEMRPSPPGLTATLLPFQEEGMSWMVHQERHTTDVRGGILADEMGMGKTLQTIAAVLDHRPKLQRCAPNVKHAPDAPDLAERKAEETLWNQSLEGWFSEMELQNVPKSLYKNKKSAGCRAGTLVVCPLIALWQWKSEIAKFCEENALTVCVYHGPKRQSEIPREVLSKYDVVLTTYQVLEAEFRNMTSPNKVTCPNCGGKFKADKLRVHLMYFCGENARRTEAQARTQRIRGRGGGRGRRGGGRGGKKNGDDKNKKSFDAPVVATPPPTTKAKTKQPAKSSSAKKAGKGPIKKAGKGPTKKARRGPAKEKKIAKTEDSDDLSSLDEKSAAVSRRKRPAAVEASRRLKTTQNDDEGEEEHALLQSDEDSDEYVNIEEDSDSDDSEDTNDIKWDPPAKHPNQRKQNNRKKSLPDSSDEEEEEDAHESDDEDSDDDARRGLARAKSKQAKALADAKKRKHGKTPPPTKTKAKPRSRKKGKKKRFDDDYSSGDDSDDYQPRKDPMADLDMKKLLKESLQGARLSVLHSCCWWRVVLDEAHMIKSRSSQTAAAAFALTSIHKWCLSGTPLQNRVGELYSLIRFLRMDPMAHYFCRKKGCTCKSIHYRMVGGRCQDCGHGGFMHFAYFNRHVLNPIQRDGYSGDGRRAMFVLKKEVLDKCLLRRTKETKAEDMNLPPRIVTIQPVRLHPIEEDFYNALYTQTRSSFDEYVTQGTVLNNYAHIFDLLTKMRQAVNHPYLIVYSRSNNNGNASRTLLQVEPSSGGSSRLPSTSVCVLCEESPPTDPVVSSCCQAPFCRSCVVDYMSVSVGDGAAGGGNNLNCPSCQQPFSMDLNQAAVVVAEPTSPETTTQQAARVGLPSIKELKHVPNHSILRRIPLENFCTSTKVEVLLQELITMRKERPGSKALVFSQFVNMLDLIRWRLHSDACLQQHGLGVSMLHGGMDVKSRNASLDDFRENANTRVMLLSLKAGGVALNLTVASEVYLMDSWWNPAAEMQAIDRTHRLGQHRPIRAVRFIAEGTVEERVLQLQEKKRLVFDGTIGRDAGSLKMLTVDDMKSLFYM